MKKITFLLLIFPFILAVSLIGCSEAQTNPALDQLANPLPAEDQETNPSGAGPMTINLGTSDEFAILSKTGISAEPTCAITGDIGTYPMNRTGLTGFSETMDSSNIFSTANQVTGQLFASDYTEPTPTKLNTAILNMETAYNEAEGRLHPNQLNLGAGEIGGLTLPPGLYKWGTDVIISNNVTLNGNPNDIWIFQISGGITVTSGAKVTLSGGALAKNIFWQSSGVVALNTTSHLEGIVLSQSSITLNTGATINGRLLAQTAVTLKSSTVIQPTL